MKSNTVQSSSSLNWAIGWAIRRAICWAVCMTTLAASVNAGTEDYTVTNLGVPDGAAYSVVGVRMNNLGHVAGWSQYFDEEPMLRGWVWTPEDGFTMLPPPPGFFLGRSRAMDVSDSGIVGGDGGFDTGLAWRYQDGQYTITGGVEGMPDAYLGGINNAGDLVGTAKDSQITTPDFAWLDINGGELMTITPSGGRGTDVNDVLQVCGYTQGQAFRWSQEGGIMLLGTLGLAFSRANRMNDAGDIVGVAISATGNTNHAWIYTDDEGMQPLPAPFFNASAAISINNARHVVGISSVSGPDLNWLWTGAETTTNITSLFDAAEAQMNVLEVRDINDAGQILVQVYDNSVPDFRMVILTPPDAAAPADLNGDGSVGPADLAELLANWGECPACPADLNGDGAVGPADLAALLAAWTS